MGSKPIPLRIDDDIIERVDRLAVAMSQKTGGVAITRSSVLRVVLERGTESLEKELGVATPKKKKS